LEIGDTITELLDDPRCFMPQRHRHRTRPVAVDDRQIGMTKTCGTDSDQHFTMTGRGEFDSSMVSGFESNEGRLRPMAFNIAALIFIDSLTFPNCLTSVSRASQGHLAEECKPTVVMSFPSDAQ
jgi:hypothetical protein